MKKRYLTICLIGLLLVITFSCISEKEQSTTTVPPTGFWREFTHIICPEGGVRVNYNGQEPCEHYWEFYAPFTALKESKYRFTLKEVTPEKCGEWYIKITFDANATDNNNTKILYVANNNTKTPFKGKVILQEFDLQGSPFVGIELHNVKSFDILMEKWEKYG